VPADLGLPGFDEVEEVGRGGFAVVYRARQVDLERSVAIKVLTGTFDDRARQRFDRERRSLGALSSHPNIVAVYGSGIAPDGRPYIVMEYAPEGSLAERIASDTSLPWPDAVGIGAKLADALAASHAAGVLHRDVKPENVLFSAYGEPKLADFGIARLAGAPATRTGVVTASLAHAAPEVLEGKRPTEAADVYSLVSTVFAAIRGHAPFMRETDESMVPVIARIASEPPPDLRGRGVPDPVCEVLERGLDKDPSKRGRAKQLAAALRAVVGGSSPMVLDAAATTDLRGATPSTTRRAPGAAPEAAGRLRSRRRTAVIVTSGVGLPLVVALAIGVSLASGGGGGGRARPTTTTVSPATASSDFVTLINGTRRSKGLTPLSVDPQLAQLAGGYAAQLAQLGVPNTTPNFSSLANQLTAQYASLGESEASGSSVDSTYRAMVASPKQQANITDATFNSIGVGVAYGTDHRTLYVVQYFGQRTS
jgi:uncharacterized protein YkwD